MWRGSSRGLTGDPVHLRAVRARPVELHLEQHVALGVLEPRPHDRRVGAAPDEGLIRRDPVRSERAEIRDRLDEVRLALTVGADEHVRPGDEVDLERRVVAEVDEAQLRDDHERRLMRTTHRAAQALRTACPPNCLRSAATAFIAGESFCRDTKRAKIDALIVGTGTA